MKSIVYATMLFAILLASYPALAQEKGDQVRAVFLFNFFKYITWPQNGDEKTLCVYGHNPFGNILDYIAEKKFSKAGYRIAYIKNVSASTQCSIAFISAKESKNADRLIKASSGTSLLTVSDAKGFATRGGGIEFVNKPGKIELVLNTKTFENAGLKASSKLMKIVKTVK